MSSAGARVVYLPPPEDEPEEGPSMRFWLSYDGELRPNQRDPVGAQNDPLAVHKQKIRKEFHRQLKYLWQTNKFLSEHMVDAAWASRFAIPANQVGAASFGYWNSEMATEKIPMSEAIANSHRENNYRFVPLVREEFDLCCSSTSCFCDVISKLASWVLAI
jgi:hypothetical protein